MLFDTPGLPPPTKIATGSIAASGAGSSNGSGGASKKRKRPEPSHNPNKQRAANGAEVNLDKLMKKMSKKQHQQGQDAGWGKPLGGKKSSAGPGGPGSGARAHAHVYDEESDRDDAPSGNSEAADGQRKKKQKKKAKGDMFSVGGGGIVGPVPGSAQSTRQDRRQAEQSPSKTKDEKRTKKDREDEASASAEPTGLRRRHTAPNHAAEPQVAAPSTGMQASLRAKLAGGKFRMLNETLYTSTGAEAFETMRDQGNFDDYHAGFRSQAAHWPVQPLSLIVSQLRAALPDRSLVADFGCGDAALARDLVGGSTADTSDKDAQQQIKVMSFDLLSKDGWVIEAECATGVPLPGTDSTKSKPAGEGQIVDAVVCCLSLMGTDWIGMVREARRVLVQGGLLKIAEVSSRFTNIDEFVSLIESVGFKFVSKDTTNTHFVMFDFVKPTLGAAAVTEVGQPKVVATNTTKAESILKPCIYKRR